MHIVSYSYTHIYICMCYIYICIYIYVSHIYIYVCMYVCVYIYYSIDISSMNPMVSQLGDQFTQYKSSINPHLCYAVRSDNLYHFWLLSDVECQFKWYLLWVPLEKAVDLWTFFVSDLLGNGARNELGLAGQTGASCLTNMGWANIRSPKSSKSSKSFKSLDPMT